MKKIFLVAIAAATTLLTACNNGSPKASLKSDIDTLSYEMGLVMSASDADFANYLTQQGSDSAYVDEFIKGYIEGMKAGDDKKQIAYNLGLQTGLQMKSQVPMFEGQVFQGDSTKKISIKNFIAGFTDFARGKVSLKLDGKLVTKEEANKQIMAYMFSKFKKEGAEFMAKKAKEQGVKEIAQGVLYKVITPSQSTERVSATDSIIVKYEGKLANGQVFDSSERQKGGTATLSLKNVIKGWQIAIPRMPIGATWEIYVPAELAYGEQGSGPIPPYSALTFKITLVGKAK